MRKVTYFQMVSLDGFIDAPNQDLSWVIVDEEIHRWANEEAKETDVDLYGRRMWEVMSSYWPTAEEDPSIRDVEREFAQIWKRTPKVVFSRTLQSVDGDARLARDPVAEVKRLREEPGEGTLGVGGATLASTLLREGLIDEVTALVNPIVLGAGTPMFPALESPIRLRLTETRRFESGVVLLRYERIDA